MPVDLRQLAHAATNRTIVFDQQPDGATTAHTESRRSGGNGLFRSAETSTRNKAQFQTLLVQLRQDPHIGASHQAVQAAFAAIGQHADSGAPLTTRLLTRALAAGDQHLVRMAQVRDRAARDMVRYAAEQLSDAKTFDALVAQASEGQSQGFGALPQGLREAMRHTVLGEWRRLQEEDSRPLDELAPKALRQQLQQAVARQLPALQHMHAAHLERPWQDTRQLMSGLTPALAAALDSVHRLSQQRTDARLSALPGQSEQVAAQHEQVLRGQIDAMGNQALLGLVRNLQSTDAIAFRLALAQAAATPGHLHAQDLLEMLNAFEGHVLDAFITRSTQAQPVANAPIGDLSPGQLTALGGQLGRDFKASLNEQSDPFLAGAPGAAPQRLEQKGANHLQQHQIDPGMLKKLVQAAPLTLNFDIDMFDRPTPRPGQPTPRSFIRADGTPNTDALRMKNIFELPVSVKGPGYLLRRDAVERHQFPELARREDRHDRRAQDRPLYAGVNVGGEQSGAAANYGSCFFVLKDEVKQRALYAPTDTFFAHRWHITPESATRFQHEVRGMLDDPASELSNPLREAVKNDPALLTDLEQKLKGAVRANTSGSGREGPIEDWVADNLKQLGKDQPFKVSIDDQGVLQAAAMRCFIDQEVRSSTLEHVDRLFRDLNQAQLEILKQFGKSPLAMNIGMQDYLEAQVFGGIDLNRDVAELHVVLTRKEDELERTDALNLANMALVAEAIGAKLVKVDASDGLDKLARILPPDSPQARARQELLKT
ncbi:MAG: DUF3626 domain-containing protein [Proteobacteria bacterium]|nr:DUF3626 domain-containing protein [Pseudomonadota bacterium]